MAAWNWPIWGMCWWCLCVCRYGLGMIYYKQEKFNLAEIHFKKALSINPQSSVLLCHIGVVSPHLTQRVITYKLKKIQKKESQVHVFICSCCCRDFGLDRYYENGWNTSRRSEYLHRLQCLLKLICLVKYVCVIHLVTSGPTSFRSIPLLLVSVFL